MFVVFVMFENGESKKQAPGCEFILMPEIWISLRPSESKTEHYSKRDVK